MTNKMISLASKKTVALLVAAASLGAGAITGSTVFAVTGGTNGAPTEKNGKFEVNGAAPSKDYAKEVGVFTASTGEVDRNAVTDGDAATSYKAGTADSYWLQVDLGKARNLESVSVRFNNQARVTGFIQYTNDKNAGESSNWTDFAKLDGATGTFTKTATGKVVSARYVRVLVNKTENTANADKAAEIAGVTDFNVVAATVFADKITVDGLQDVHETHIGDVYNFTTKTTPADADVDWNVDTAGSNAFKIEHGATDENGVTHWTMTVQHSTAGVDVPVTITNRNVKAADNGGKVPAQIVLQQNFSSWDYAGSITPSAFEGNEQLFIGDTANGGKGAQIAAAVNGKNGEIAKQEFDVTTDTDALKTTIVDRNNAAGERVGQDLFVKGVKVGNGKVILTAKDTAPVKDDKGNVTGHEKVDASLNFVSNYHSATGFVDGSIKAPSEITLGDKGTYKVEAKVAPAETANQNVTFKSSDEKTLTIGADGALTPHVEGLGNGDSKTVTVTITAPKVLGNEKDVSTTVNVTVKRPAVQSVTIESGLKDGVITLGDATEKGLALKATVSPEFANPELTWASSNTKVATVDKAGNVKFTGEPGFVVITASSTHGVGGDKAPVVGSTAINVVRPKVTSLTAYKAGDEKKTPVTELTHVLGEEAAPVDLDVAASPKYADDSVYWITGDASIADVDAKTGVVTFHETEGSTTVTAVSVVDGTVQARVNVKTTAPAPTAVTITTPEGFDPAKVKVGDKFQLTAAVTPALAHQDVKWTSSDEKVATVDANGNVTVLAEGAVKITATSAENDKATGSVEFTAVKAGEPSKPGEDAFAKVKATYADADGKTVDVAGFDASKDGEYTLPEGVTLDKVTLATDGLDTKIAYTADGKAVENGSKADTAVYTVTDGKTTRVYTFKTAEKKADATKTVKVTLKQNNGLPDEIAAKLPDQVKDAKPGDKFIKIMDPFVTGYTFKGWSLNADGKELVDIDGFTVPDEDVTLYAVWQKGTDTDNGTPGAGTDTEPGKTDNTVNKGDDKKGADGNKKTAGTDGKTGDTSKDLAKTGAAVGIIAAVSAALAGAGVALRKTSKRD